MVTLSICCSLGGTHSSLSVQARTQPTGEAAQASRQPSCLPSNHGFETDVGGLPVSLGLDFLIRGEQQNLSVTLLGGLTALIPGKCLGQCMAPSKHGLMWGLEKHALAKEHQSDDTGTFQTASMKRPQ